jgi:predicted nucleic acid-binding protein
VILDTSVLSAALRRSTDSQLRPIQLAVRDALAAGLGIVIGPVRQELLSGFRDPNRFRAMRERLRVIQDEPCLTVDFERAAEFTNLCASRGIAGTPVDFLICAVAERFAVPIFTLDRTFDRYASVLPIEVYPGASS